MSQITTHILDTSRGMPAVGVEVSLHQRDGSSWSLLAKGITDTDGRVTDLLVKEQVLTAGEYKICFETAAYFSNLNEKTFFPFVDIAFQVDASSGQHYHVPLLLSAFAFSTYRGS